MRPLQAAVRGLALALLVAAACVGAGGVVEDRSATTRALVEWALARGAEMPGAVVGHACPACPRGVFATKDLAEGELIMRVPLSVALPVSQQDPRLLDDTPGAAEYARELLIRWQTDPSFNATWGAYWATVPQPGETLTFELFTDAELEMLQEPTLAAWAKLRREAATAVYNGMAESTFDEEVYSPLPETVPESIANLTTFLHIVSLLNTRSFEPYQGEDLQIPCPYMVPLADMVNHALHPNTREADLIQNGRLNIVAGRDITKGEEITFNYGTSGMHRPDRSLLFYGFVEPQARPLLCAQDLPPGYPVESLADPPYDDPASDFASLAEYRRLATLLESLPTTEAEDQLLLDSTLVTDWRERTILEFRIMRKRALRQALAKLGVALQAGRASQPEHKAEL